MIDLYWFSIAFYFLQLIPFFCAIWRYESKFQAPEKWFESGGRMATSHDSQNASDFLGNFGAWNWWTKKKSLAILNYRPGISGYKKTHGKLFEANGKGFFSGQLKCFFFPILNLWSISNNEDFLIAFWDKGIDPSHREMASMYGISIEIQIFPYTVIKENPIPPRYLHPPSVLTLEVPIRFTLRNPPRFLSSQRGSGRLLRLCAASRKQATSLGSEVWVRGWEYVLHGTRRLEMGGWGWLIWCQCCFEHRSMYLSDVLFCIYPHGYRWREVEVTFLQKSCSFLHVIWHEY